ncbi:hypothetical protein PG996_013318 [Apiospora saccharicola]|uniref:Uncharacterized protein n=1 Tax=Apiospora saccharicola TaxID=335842 RepID=A0ABR1U558_9PEZI
MAQVDGPAPPGWDLSEYEANGSENLDASLHLQEPDANAQEDFEVVKVPDGVISGHSSDTLGKCYKTTQESQRLPKDRDRAARGHSRSPAAIQESELCFEGSL